MLCDYCAERGIGNNRCGNLIVATSPSQFEQLQSIIIRAAANGVRDLRLLTRAKAQGMEPQLECVAAIHSPSTGIVDSHTLMLSLQGDIENAGRCILLNPAVDWSMSTILTARRQLSWPVEAGNELNGLLS